MIEHELILLGLLKGSPKHGYEIKKEVKEIFSLFAGVDLKSIYYPLKVLEKKDLVIKHTLKPGRRPARYEYELTQKGESRFNSLLENSFLDFKRPQFSLDLCLYFLNYIRPQVAKRRLRARIYILNNLSKSLRQMVKVFEKKNPSSLVRILNHNLKMIEAESQFLASLTETI